MTAILKREIFTYFTSPLGYVYIALCFFVASSSFMVSVSSGSADLTGVFLVLVIVQFVFTPFLTMRLLSEEQKQKTDQLLLTSPVSLTGLVIAKFLAAFIVFLISISISLIYAVALELIPNVSVAWSTVTGNFLGLSLIGGLFIATGLFVSALTESQMIAAVISFFVNFFLFMISNFAGYAPWGWLKTFMQKISVYERFSDISFGIIHISTLLYFASIIFVFLFLTIQRLSARRYS
ncbi:MAG: ABC-2 transporter permease [Oscillospiraceae bacterium]|jgi:ABC-2 type transport system permease protein|nr:ABC-2 transporter permease [Oscillospiraceae bacterium]